MSRQQRSRRHEANGFTCINCGLEVPGVAWGTKHRNHCPACLHSRHVDDRPGDRASPCRAVMVPVGIEVRGDDGAGGIVGSPGAGGEWAIIHRCSGCGVLKANRVAGDDSERALLALALRPLARPAFPLDDAR